MESLSSLRARAEKVATRSFSIIAVSKNQPVEKIEALYQQGHRDFGENYTQELQEKSQWFKQKGRPDIRWHFLGHLQTNKVKKTIPFITTLHSLDTLKLAEKLNAEILAQSQKPLSVFVEVNIDQEASKTGLRPTEVSAFCQKLRDFSSLRIEGLMGIPNPQGDARAAFKRLADLSKSLGPLTHGHLSMGMSHDFEIALQEGATYIRVGTALFGPRASTRSSVG